MSAIQLEGWDHVELWVGNARQASHFFASGLGFEAVAYAGPETGATDPRSCVRSWATVQSKCRLRTSAAAPVTNGAAIEVPSRLP